MVGGVLVDWVVGYMVVFFVLTLAGCLDNFWLFRWLVCCLVAKLVGL